jgi:hypothetical protein
MIEALGKELLATIDNIDHKHFHFAIAKAPEALTRDLAVGRVLFDIGVVHPTL